MHGGIGVIDSGVGGLSVVREIKRLFPFETIVYYGDSKNCPYGNRSVEEIINLTMKAVEFLINKNVRIIVLACNTASAEALDYIKSKVNVPVIGMIEAGARLTVETTVNKRVGLIGTTSTVNSKKYIQEIGKMDDQISVFAKACPELATMIEHQLVQGNQLELYLKACLEEIQMEGIDSLILGCTHYPFVTESIKKLLPNVKLIDPACKVAEEMEQYVSVGSTVGNDSYHVTAFPNEFRLFGEKVLGRSLFVEEILTNAEIDDALERKLFPYLNNYRRMRLQG